MATCPLLVKKAYYDGMRTLCLLTLLLICPLTVAAEQLPDASQPGAADDASAMQQRMKTPAMNHDEMENVYLQSPVELGNREEEGMRSVTDDSRYPETDLLSREQLQNRNSSLQPPPDLDRTPPPPLPLSGQQL